MHTYISVVFALLFVVSIKSCVLFIEDRKILDTSAFCKNKIGKFKTRKKSKTSKVLSYK